MSTMQQGQKKRRHMRNSCSEMTTPRAWKRSSSPDYGFATPVGKTRIFTGKRRDAHATVTWACPSRSASKCRKMLSLPASTYAVLPYHRVTFCPPPRHQYNLNPIFHYQYEKEKEITRRRIDKENKEKADAASKIQGYFRRRRSSVIGAGNALRSSGRRESLMPVTFDLTNRVEAEEVRFN